MGWLQYPTIILAYGMLALIVGVWWITSANLDAPPWLILILIIGVGVVGGLSFWVGVVLVMVASVGVISLNRLNRLSAPESTATFNRRVALLGIVLVVALLVWSKAWGWAWVGFSYVAFRLMAVLLDYRQGRLLAFTLPEFVTYTLFFPALTAGPIDHASRFIEELRQNKPLDAATVVVGGGRVAVGLFKKFVIADSLARISLTPALITLTDSRAGLWLWVYVYSFYIFFDFSGYSDIAIGLGRLYGITLPENFDRPYLQRNLQQFWQRWHMTLSGWFRTYYFLPLSRWCIRRRWPTYLTLFVALLSTFLLIGLWHGLTVNFALWGLWHGVGLFAHRWLVDHTRGWYRWVRQRRWLRSMVHIGGIGLTFHYVVLGWVFFALPTTADSVDLLLRLLGGR